MKNKRLIFLIIPLFLIGSMMISNQNDHLSQAWGLVVHQYASGEAAVLMPTEWQEAFTFYRPEIIAGSTYPDQVLQDWENHLYYPDDPTGYNGPWHINDTITAIKNNITLGDWETVFLTLGIVSHYTADLNIPVHTGPIWGGDVETPNGHSAYEKDINYYLDNLTITPHNFDPITDPVQFMIDCATYANQYYWDVRNVYVDGNVRDVLLTNATIKELTEEQLGRAIGAIEAIWEYALEDITPPEVEVVEDVATVLIDTYHDNDYASDNQLTSFIDTLDRDVVEVLSNEAPITASTLVGINLLVITAPFESYFTAEEISAITTWYASGNHILMSGRGDFADANHSSTNELLEGIGADMRVNDDNVYTTPADPEYYKDWYCKTDEFDTSNAAGDFITGNLTQKIQFFSPSSLYSAEGTGLIDWFIYGEETFYQTDQYDPAPAVIYDDTNDNVGGTAIPMAGVEYMGDSSIALFGSTVWSDFDFGLTDKDNVDLMWYTIEYLLDIDLNANDDGGTEPIDPTDPTDPTDPASFTSFTIIVSSLGVAYLISLITKRK